MLIMRHKPGAEYPWQFHISPSLSSGEWLRLDKDVHRWLADFSPSMPDAVKAIDGRWSLGFDTKSGGPSGVPHDLIVTYDFRDEADAMHFKLRWA
jgi:hypothetical protein